MLTPEKRKKRKKKTHTREAEKERREGGGVGEEEVQRKKERKIGTARNQSDVSSGHLFFSCSLPFPGTVAVFISMASAPISRNGRRLSRSSQGAVTLQNLSITEQDGGADGC